MIIRKLLAATALLTPCALAIGADPSSATISEATPELTYTSGPFLVRNASAGASSRPR